MPEDPALGAATEQRLGGTGYSRARTRRRVVWLSALLGFVVAIACVAVAGYNRERYGVFAPWATPTRIHYCGRDFQAGSVVTGTPASLLVQTSFRWKRVTSTLSGTPIFAGVAPSSPGQPCPMTLYLSQGDGHYRAYALEGGP